ncbi:MAG: hypothetical protein DHS20C04_12730 [Hyphococcus sp.]|nr:MAG: hypothetical protein DHS20C04_12730 [Marinicaulis sp.]
MQAFTCWLASDFIVMAQFDEIVNNDSHDAEQQKERPYCRPLYNHSPPQNENKHLRGTQVLVFNQYGKQRD